MILQVLENDPKFLTAHEIVAHTREQYPDMGLDTVYRNLNLLTQLGVVNQLSIPGKDGKIFGLARSSQHHHHLVCLGCGDATSVEYCPVNYSDIPQKECGNFTITRHSLEFYGYCPKCGADT
jgi:Fe2+ or Zn2+ uptake regulation protein